MTKNVAEITLEFLEMGISDRICVDGREYYGSSKNFIGSRILI